MSLELAVLQEQLGRKKGSLITQDTVDELNKLIEDPEYGEDFVDAYRQYFNILDKNNQWSTPKYMSAMKFFILMESGHSAVDAYVKVFPERLEARHARGESKTDMGGEASRYNASQLVNEIRKVAGIGVKLTHRYMLMDALDITHRLMNDRNVSPAVRQKAAETLIRELKPDDKTEISIEIKNDVSAIDELRKATEALVLEQRRSIEAGIAVKFIAESKIIEGELYE
jgi:hypothetical protein